MLGTDAVHIWGANVPEMRVRLDALSAVLNSDELAKADRFRREADRACSIVARGALRLLLAGYTGLSAAELVFGYSENGKPFLVSPGWLTPRFASGRPQKERGRQDACGTISFNISHSGDWVVLAFGRGRQVGVDIEQLNRATDVLAIAERYFAEEEIEVIRRADDPHAAFFNLWARKEAYIKACGSVLFRELTSFAVPTDDVEKDGWFFQRLEAGSKYAAAVVTDKAVESMPCFDFGGMQWDS
ncbi:4'-phosphopantetheinyl transferase superfamily protein [Pontiellaceae bacterium B12219]|nr:4'-phosphopantetheinyl transferase superfamily protein [Pontiellaceae bacterium B12219]